MTSTNTTISIIAWTNFGYPREIFQILKQQSQQPTELIFCQHADYLQVVDLIPENQAIEVSYVPAEKTPSLSLGVAIECASGDFVKILDHPIEWPENFLERQAHQLQQHAECSIALSKLKPAGSALPCVSLELLPWLSAEHILSGDDLLNYLSQAPLNFLGHLSQATFRQQQLIDYCPDILRFNGRYLPLHNSLVLYSKALRHGDVYLDNQLPVPEAQRCSAPQRSQVEHQQIPKKQTSLNEKFSQHLSALNRKRQVADAWINCRRPATGALQRLSLFETLQRNEWHAASLYQRSQAQPPAQVLSRLTEKLNAQDAPRLALLAENPQQIELPAPWPALLPVLDRHDLASRPDIDWVIAIAGSVQLDIAGMSEMLLEALQNQQFPVVYSDSFHVDETGILQPIHLPTGNLDYLCAAPFHFAKLLLIHRSIFQPLLADSPSIYALNLRSLFQCIYQHGLERLGHIPTATFTSCGYPDVFIPTERQELSTFLLQRGYLEHQINSLEATPGLHHLAYQKPTKIFTSILLNGQESPENIDRCIRSILLQSTQGFFEIILIKPAQLLPESLQLLEKFSASFPEYFQSIPASGQAFDNFRRAAQLARGVNIVWMGTGHYVEQADWLEQLANELSRPEVAAVSPKVIFPNQATKNFGPFFLTIGFDARNLYAHDPRYQQGYLQRLRFTQNLSCLDEQCFAIKQEVLHTMLAEVASSPSASLQHLFLRLTNQGQLLVWTPACVLTSSIPLPPPPAPGQEYLVEQFAAVMLADRAANPQLSGQNRHLEPQFRPLAHWSIEPSKPVPKAHRIAATYLDVGGCGYYRVIHPGQAIQSHELGHVVLNKAPPTLGELMHHDIGTLVLQRPFNSAYVPYLKEIRRHSDIYITAEVDDNYLDIHRKHPLHGEHPRDLQKTMRESLALVDCFVVSTPELANRYAQLHGNIRIQPNLLPIDLWSQLSLKPNPGRRPRVGWGGGSSHQGDLELISDVVKALHQEVEWVFFGMCPEVLRSYVHEVRPPVLIEAYPQALADLQLDLAIAPLEDHSFNACKSDLRLLEYGACGFPVVCSAIGPYLASKLPVTKVKNTYKAWTQAIRMHLADPVANAKQGQLLRAQILQRHMLDASQADVWLQHWTDR